MSAMSDAIIIYAILRKFTTPIKETQAYKLGLVDEHGVPTEKSKHDSSITANDAYTLLDRLVFKLKRMWSSMPAFAKLVGGYATALAFLKESVDESYSVFEHLDSTKADYWGSVLLGESIVGFTQHMIIKVAENPYQLARLVEAYENGTQDDFMYEEEGAGPAPAGNSVSTGQVQGLATEPVITKDMQKKWTSGRVGRKVEVITENENVSISFHDMFMNQDGYATASSALSGHRYGGYNSDKPVAVTHIGNGKYYLLDGYHRTLQAAKDGETSINARVVQQDEQMVKRMTAEKFNQSNAVVYKDGRFNWQ